MNGAAPVAGRIAEQAAAMRACLHRLAPLVRPARAATGPVAKQEWLEGCAQLIQANDHLAVLAASVGVSWRPWQFGGRHPTPDGVLLAVQAFGALLATIEERMNRGAKAAAGAMPAATWSRLYVKSAERHLRTAAQLGHDELAEKLMAEAWDPWPELDAAPDADQVDAAGGVGG